MNTHPFTLEAMADLAVMHPNVGVDFNDEDFDYTGLIDIAGFTALEPGQGYGAAALQHICNLADKHGVRLEVYAGVRADGCDAMRLIGFYSRFGFILQPTPWDEDCHTGRPWLIREPRP